jgi:TM2 domain-containing membrane protein YozV
MSGVCPYCRAEIAADDASRVFCNGCGTPHHKECYEENGGCTLFGCKYAPPDEPKLQVTTGEALSAPGWPAAASPTAQATGFGDVGAGIGLGLASQPQTTTTRTPPPPPPPGLAGSPPVASASPVPSYGTPGSILFAAPPVATATPQQLPKSRIGFILLGIFLGSLGAHNFYAGYTKRGVWQLSISVLTFFYGSIVSWIWAIVEVCTVDRDARNITFV